MTDVTNAIVLASLLLDVGARILRTVVTGSASAAEMAAIRRVLGAELAAKVMLAAADARSRAGLGNE